MFLSRFGFVIYDFCVQHFRQILPYVGNVLASPGIKIYERLGDNREIRNGSLDKNSLDLSKISTMIITSGQLPAQS